MSATELLCVEEQVVANEPAPVPPRYIATREDGLGHGHAPYWEYDGCVFYEKDEALLAYLREVPNPSGLTS
jgi:hypothetical protein